MLFGSVSTDMTAPELPPTKTIKRATDRGREQEGLLVDEVEEVVGREQGGWTDWVEVRELRLEAADDKRTIFSQPLFHQANSSTVTVRGRATRGGERRGGGGHRDEVQELRPPSRALSPSQPRPPCL